MMIIPEISAINIIKPFEKNVSDRKTGIRAIA